MDSMEEYKADRTVLFVPANDTIALVESSKDFTGEELRLSWHSSPEMIEMRDRCIKHTLKLELGDVKNPSCYRGLEGFTTERSESSTNSVVACIDAVMDEQEMQWDREEDDFDRIAAISRDLSKCSIDRAIMRAKEDEREARRIYSPVEKVSERSERSEPGFDMEEPVLTRRKQEMFSMMIDPGFISGKGRRRRRSKNDSMYDSDTSRTTQESDISRTTQEKGPGGMQCCSRILDVF